MLRYRPRPGDPAVCE